MQTKNFCVTYDGILIFNTQKERGDIVNLFFLLFVLSNNSQKWTADMNDNNRTNNRKQFVHEDKQDEFLFIFFKFRTLLLRATKIELFFLNLFAF